MSALTAGGGAATVSAGRGEGHNRALDIELALEEVFAILLLDSVLVPLGWSPCAEADGAWDPAPGEPQGSWQDA